jgi:hypothetical protein
MSANLRIVPRNFHYEATLSTEFAPAVGYPIVNTQNRSRSRVWRSDGNADQWVRGTVMDATSRTTDFFGMFRHRCHGGSVRLRLYSDDAWSSLALDSGVVSASPIVGTDGAAWGIDPHGVGENDPFLTEAPFFIWHAPTAWRSYEIAFSGNSDTTDFGVHFWEVGTFWLGRSFAPQRQPAFGAEVGFLDFTDLERSRGGSLYSNVGAQARTMRFSLTAIEEDERAAWMDIARRCGLGRDVVVSWFAEEGTRRERDHTMHGTFSALNAIGRPVRVLTHTLQFQEA